MIRSCNLIVATVYKQAGAVHAGLLSKFEALELKAQYVTHSLTPFSSSLHIRTTKSNEHNISNVDLKVSECGKSRKSLMKVQLSINAEWAVE